MFNIEISAALLAGVAGALPVLLREVLGLALEHSQWLRTSFDSPFGRTLLKNLRVRIPGQPTETKDLLAELTKTSAEMDRIVGEIGRFTKERQAAVLKLEGDLAVLSEREEELKRNIEGLQNVPLPAAEYFAKLVIRTEKKSAARDYVLFLIGVIVSTVVTVLLKHFGWV